MNTAPRRPPLSPLGRHGERPLSQAISPARVIAVCGPAAQVGKTTLVANLGFALADKGMRVCLFDADNSLSSVGTQLGLSPPHTFDDYLQGNTELDNALWSVSDGLQLMPGAARSGDFARLEPPAQARLLQGLQRLESVFDYLLVDCAGGDTESQLQLIQAAPFVVVTVTTAPDTQTGAFALLERLAERGFRRPVMVVVNQVEETAAARRAFRRLERALQLRLPLRAHLLGYLHTDPCIADAARRQQPFVRLCPDAQATHHLEVIAHRLHQVARNTESAAGEFSGHFDALTLAEEAQRRRNDPESLLRELEQAIAGLDRQGLAELLAGIVSRWERHHGETLETPLPEPAVPAPTPTPAAEPPEEPPPPLQATGTADKAEVPPLAILRSETPPAPSQNGARETADALTAAARIAARVGSR